MGKLRCRRLLSVVLTIILLFTSTACEQKQPDQTTAKKISLELPLAYMSPVIASHATVLMPFVLPANGPSEAVFQKAWEAQTTYILDRARLVTEHGHAFHARLMKAIEGLISQSGQPASSITPILEAYNRALLQADTLAGLVQGKKIDTPSSQAILSYNWVLASANLMQQSNAAVSELIQTVPTVISGPQGTSTDPAKLDPLLKELLDAHGDLLTSSRQMVTAHARLVISDQILGSLLDGAILAETESVIEETAQLASEKRIDPKTAEGVEEQLQSIIGGLTAKSSPASYTASAKGFIEIVAAATDSLFSPVDYLADLTGQALEPVLSPVRGAIDQLYEAADEASGERISALSDLVLSYADPLADYLGIPREQSIEILQSAALSASELGQMDGPQLQLISDAALAEFEYLDRADVQLQDFLEANGLQIVVEMIGYFQTLENDTYDWLDHAYDATAEFLSMPPDEAIEQTQADIDQLVALMFGEKPAQSDLDWLCSLLGVDPEALTEDVLSSRSEWMHTLESMADELADFLGEDTVDLLSALNDMLMVPVELAEYPFVRIGDAISWIGRYAVAQQDRMTLAMLESLQALYVQLGIMENPAFNLDDLTEEVSQSLDALFDQKDLIRNLETLTEDELEEALSDLLAEVTQGGTNPQVRDELIHQLEFLLGLLDSGTGTPTPTGTATTTTPANATSVTVTPTTAPSPTPVPTVPAEPTPEPDDVWIGEWSGTMRITHIDQPDVYSPEEQEALLKTTFPIAFTVTRAAGGDYEITILNNQGGDVSASIDGRQITILFTNQLPDGSQTLYQNFEGTLAADNRTVQGEFTTSIESAGSFYSGTWTVTK